MYILLQHFPEEAKAILKKFDTISDIEEYMESKIETSSNNVWFDCYSGKSWAQIQLVESPVYKSVFDFIFNDDSNAIIYDIHKDFNYIHIKFDNDGNHAPYIRSILDDYNGQLLDSENIINTNDLKSDIIDEYDKNYVVKF